jgi:hypothetical protein
MRALHYRKGDKLKSKYYCSMAIPNSVIDTRTKIFGMKTYIDNLIPNCGSCFVISGPHEKTKEIGFYASCKNLENLS